jgi:archaellum component FlaF (FlaF/FlaG flagellin family)
MQEEMRPVINMGNGNSGNTNNVETGFMGLSIGQIASTLVVIATLLISGGMQWSQYQAALERIDKLESVITQVVSTTQAMQVKLAQNDKTVEATVDTIKELKATVGEFTKTVNMLNGTVSKLDGQLSSK